MKVKTEEGRLVVSMRMTEAETFEKFLGDGVFDDIGYGKGKDGEVISQIKERLIDELSSDTRAISHDADGHPCLSFELTSREIEWVLSKLGGWARERQMEWNSMSELNDLLNKAAS